MNERLDFDQIARYMDNEQTVVDKLRDDVVRLGWLIEEMTVLQQMSVNGALGVGGFYSGHEDFLFDCKYQDKQYTFKLYKGEDAYYLYKTLQFKLESIDQN